MNMVTYSRSEEGMHKKNEGVALVQPNSIPYTGSFGLREACKLDHLALELSIETLVEYRIACEAALYLYPKE